MTHIFFLSNFQVIRSWATGRRHSDPDERADSFLEKFAMGGSQTQSDSAVARLRKLSDPR